MDAPERTHYFLWELGSYANELKLGYVDEDPFEPGFNKVGQPARNWQLWTQYDRLGPMPDDIAPERFYLWSALRSRGSVGDFSGTSESAVKVATKRIIDSMLALGQQDVRIFPLTFWRRSEGSNAPPPDADEPLCAIHCWAKIDIFDLDRSEVSRVNPWYYTRLTSNPYDDGNPEPPILSSWTNLVLRQGVAAENVTLPPLFGIPGLHHRLFVSPQFVDLLHRRRFRVNLIERPLDLPAGWAVAHALQEGRPPPTRLINTPLGS